MHDPDESFVGATTDRAVALYARGDYERAFFTLGPVMAAREQSLAAATGLALRIDAEWQAMAAKGEDPGWYRVDGLPPDRERAAAPVIEQVLNLARGHNYGGLHFVWHELAPPLAADVLAALLAMAGVSARHPESN